MKRIIPVVWCWVVCVLLPIQPAVAQEEAAKWYDRLTLSGLIELEAGFESSDPVEGEGEDSSDFTIATVELAVEADIVDHVSGNILFLYEDGEDVAVDEAVITISGEDAAPVYLAGGLFYVPFGHFESQMISDPLTLEIGEAQEVGVDAGFEMHGVYGSAFLFNGDVDESGETDDTIDNFGAHAGYAMEADAVQFDVGVSYINNLIDADGWGDIIDEEGLALASYTGGAGAYAVMGFGPVCFIAEYVTALDDLQWIDAEGNTFVEEAVSAWNVEVGLGFDLVGKAANVAVGYQGTDNAYDRLPEIRYLGSFGVGIFDGTTAAVEYLHDEFEGGDEADVITLQLAFEW